MPEQSLHILDRNQVLSEGRIRPADDLECQCNYPQAEPVDLLRFLAARLNSCPFKTGLVQSFPGASAGVKLDHSGTTISRLRGARIMKMPATIIQAARGKPEATPKGPQPAGL